MDEREKKKKRKRKEIQTDRKYSERRPYRNACSGVAPRHVYARRTNDVTLSSSSPPSFFSASTPRVHSTLDPSKHWRTSPRHQKRGTLYGPPLSLARGVESHVRRGPARASRVRRGGRCRHRACTRATVDHGMRDPFLSSASQRLPRREGRRTHYSSARVSDRLKSRQIGRPTGE